MHGMAWCGREARLRRPCGSRTPGKQGHESAPGVWSSPNALSPSRTPARASLPAKHVAAGRNLLVAAGPARACTLGRRAGRHMPLCWQGKHVVKPLPPSTEQAPLASPSKTATLDTLHSTPPFAPDRRAAAGTALWHSSKGSRPAATSSAEGQAAAAMAGEPLSRRNTSPPWSTCTLQLGCMTGECGAWGVHFEWIRERVGGVPGTPGQRSGTATALRLTWGAAAWPEICRCR